MNTYYRPHCRRKLARHFRVPGLGERAESTLGIGHRDETANVMSWNVCFLSFLLRRMRARLKNVVPHVPCTQPYPYLHRAQMYIDLAPEIDRIQVNHPSQQKIYHPAGTQLTQPHSSLNDASSLSFFAMP